MQREIKILKLSTGKVNLCLKALSPGSVQTKQKWPLEEGTVVLLPDVGKMMDMILKERQLQTASESVSDRVWADWNTGGFFLKRKTVEIRKKKKTTM